MVERRIKQARFPAVKSLDSFDFLALSALHERLVKGTYCMPNCAKLISTVVTSRTEGQIPDDRRPIWDDLIKRECVAMIPGEWSWTSGAVRRSLLA
jgi:hypothetical protein